MSIDFCLLPPARKMETFHGYIESLDDAMILFNACQMGYLPRAFAKTP